MDSWGEKERLQDKGTFLEREINHCLFNSKHSNRHLKLFCLANRKLNSILWSSIGLSIQISILYGALC